MPVIVQCEACGVRLKAPEKLMGKRLRCRCGAAVPMPPDPLGPEVADLSGLIDEISPVAMSCPSCGVAMDATAVLCIACGFNKSTGKKMKSAEAAPTRKAKSKSKENGKSAPAPAAKGDSERGAAKARVWKLAMFVVAAGVIFGAVWFIKGAIGLSPREQAADKLDDVYPGMTIEEVVKALGKPPKEAYATVDGAKFGLGGGMKEAKIAYAENFLEAHGPKKLEYGFKFVYKYSERDQLHVHFSPDGRVESAEKVDPMAALGL
jgi:hypothetical protein